MSVIESPIRQERLSELVTQLCGAPLDRSRVAVAQATLRNARDGDTLRDVADALVSIRAQVG